MEEIKLFVTEKKTLKTVKVYIFIVTLFGVFGPKELRCKEQKRQNSIDLFVPQVHGFDLRLSFKKSSKPLWRDKNFENPVFSKVMALFLDQRFFRILTQGLKP